MRRHHLLVLGVILAVVGISPGVRAQGYYYPGGYGGYGWGGWGADPASGYMAGLGSFARGQGVYQVEAAKARAINLETTLKWNKALRQRQKELAAEQAKRDAAEEVQREARVARALLENGTTLNSLLSQIQDFDPVASKSARSKASLGASAIREIPFQWNTEAITLCLDQMLGKGALPDPLMDSRFDSQRIALGSAVQAAIKEDAKGDVSPNTSKRLADAVSAFHDSFVKAVPDTFSSFPECDEYLTTLGSLTRLLHDPSMKKALVELDEEKPVTIGDLLVFMTTYNLRFGPASNDRQVRIYEVLAARLAEVLDAVNDSPAPPDAVVPKDAKALPAAAREAFKGVGWQQLEAHARGR